MGTYIKTPPLYHSGSMHPSADQVSIHIAPQNTNDKNAACAQRHTIATIRPEGDALENASSHSRCSALKSGYNTLHRYTELPIWAKNLFFLVDYATTLHYTFFLSQMDDLRKEYREPRPDGSPPPIPASIAGVPISDQERQSLENRFPNDPGSQARTTVNWLPIAPIAMSGLLMITQTVLTAILMPKLLR